jgi:hypothetical protein
MQRVLRTHFPDARLITQAEADVSVVPELRRRGWTRLESLRATCPVMLKLVDVALCATADRLLVLDSDVLFFQPPAQLVAAAAEGGSVVFQQDVESCYVLSFDDARALGVPLQPRINTGIIAIDRSMIDLERCERLLEHPAFRVPSGWVEQTLYALLGSTQSRLSLLSPAYAVSMHESPCPADVVARHYSGLSRPYLTSDGMAWLLREGRVEAALAQPAVS